MSFTRCSHLVTLLASLILTTALAAQQPTATITAAPPPAESPTQPPPHGTYPQIVRLSLVEGDVRVTRGKQDAQLAGSEWEQAAAGLPLRSGFNLVTGPDGHAEIEFEDASTLYLAPNSALAFTDLTTKDGVPHTTITLLSGTITTHLAPNIANENYTIYTPTHSIGVTDGEHNYLRITSFLDGMKVTPQENEHFTFAHTHRLHILAGLTYVYSGGSVSLQHATSPDPLTSWDAWVSNRIHTRHAAMQAVMHQAGLSIPLPGLADMADQGTFTPCAPYGTCWEPKNGWVPPQTDAAQANGAQNAGDAQSVSNQTTAVSPRSSATVVAHTANATRQTPLLYAGDDDYDLFPCFQPSLWYLHHYSAVDYSYIDLYPSSYDWAVCHTGSWIYRQHRYLWVAGTHKHHRCPVRWVKYQGKLGYVPMHPRDERGKLPINVRHGVFTLPRKAGDSIQRVAFDPKSRVTPIATTPKEFRSPALPTLARAESPQLNVHFLHERSEASLHGQPRDTASHGPALTFDHHSQRFMLATRVTENGRTTTVTEPFSNRNGAIHSEGGYSSFHGGEAHGGYSGGGSGHSSSGEGGHSYSGGGSSGGGSHAGGGGGFSGGGGSHGGGGGGFSGGSSSSSGASSSGSSSGGGGGHH